MKCTADESEMLRENGSGLFAVGCETAVLDAIAVHTAQRFNQRRAR